MIRHPRPTWEENRDSMGPKQDGAPLLVLGAEMRPHKSDGRHVVAADAECTLAWATSGTHVHSGSKRFWLRDHRCPRIRQGRCKLPRRRDGAGLEGRIVKPTDTAREGRCRSLAARRASTQRPPLRVVYRRPGPARQRALGPPSHRHQQRQRRRDFIKALLRAD